MDSNTFGMTGLLKFYSLYELPFSNCPFGITMLPTGLRYKISTTQMLET